jgi:hypothetical protein
MARRYRGNARLVTTVAFGPGATSVELATAMAVATLPFSPMAAGVHSPGATARGYPGVPGYGVNRMGQDVGPLQAFYGAVQPIADPLSRRLGANVGVSGQPGMPQSGQDATGLAGLSLGQLSSLGYGA